MEIVKLNISKSYRAAECCGAECDWFDEDKVCWGQVNVVDEVDDGDGDWYWVHACEGHQEICYGGEYQEEK